MTDIDNLIDQIRTMRADRYADRARLDIDLVRLDAALTALAGDDALVAAPDAFTVWTRIPDGVTPIVDAAPPPEATPEPIVVMVCGPDAGEPTAEQLAEPEPEIADCPACSGKGWANEQIGNTDVCHDCSGTGLVPAYMLEHADDVPAPVPAPEEIVLEQPAEIDVPVYLRTPADRDARIAAAVAEREATKVAKAARVAERDAKIAELVNGRPAGVTPARVVADHFGWKLSTALTNISEARRHGYTIPREITIAEPVHEPAPVPERVVVPTIPTHREIGEFIDRARSAGSTNVIDDMAAHWNVDLDRATRWHDEADRRGLIPAHTSWTAADALNELEQLR